MRTAMTLVALLLTTLAPPAAAAAPPPIPVVDYLKRITGTRTVTGMHNKEPNSDPARHTAKVHAITGVYPGLWGGDFLFAQDDVAHRQTMVDQAKFGKSVDAVQSLGIKTIAGCHTPVLEGSLITQALDTTRAFPSVVPPPLPDQSVLDQIIAATALPVA